MTNVIQIADEADMIINGYAFKKNNNQIRVLNLNNPEKAVVFDRKGSVLETSMDDIEIQIVENYLSKNVECMED